MHAYSVVCLDCNYSAVGIVDTKDLAKEIGAQIAQDHVVFTQLHTLVASYGEYHIPKEDAPDDQEYEYA